MTDVLFTHYGRLPDGSFAPPGRDTTTADLDGMFADCPAKLVLFGHDHAAIDTTSTHRRYVNPGSVGCYHRPEARYVIVEPHQGDVLIHGCASEYDDSSVFADLERRAVPARSYIQAAFLPRD